MSNRAPSIRFGRRFDLTGHPQHFRTPGFRNAFNHNGYRTRFGLTQLAVLTAGLILMWGICFPAAEMVLADEVVLNTGERFTSSKVWEEDGKLRFDMQGLIVSVGMEDVAAVIRDRGPSSPPEPETPPVGQWPQTSPQTATVPPLQEPLEKPAPKDAPDPPPTPDETARHPKAMGTGLDGLHWHKKPTEIPGIEKLESDPADDGIDQYWRPGGNLTLGDALLDGLVLGFWRNRLYSIMVWVDGKPGYARLQQAVFHHFGKGRKNENGLERYIWLDDTTDRMLEFDPKLNTGIFWMRSRELDQQIKKLDPN